MRKHLLQIILVLWILGILLPMAFLGQFLPTFGHFFNLVFSPGWMHLLMHILLYAILGLLMMMLFKPTSNKASFAILVGCMAVGLLHESLQLISARTWPGFGPEILDLGVDTIGSLLGICLGILVRQWTTRKNGKQESKPHSI